MNPLAKALLFGSTKDRSTPVIPTPRFAEECFGICTYVGTDNTINLDFGMDLASESNVLLWTKSTSGSGNNALWIKDSTDYNKPLSFDRLQQETILNNQGLQGFTSTGATFGRNSAYDENDIGSNHVAYAFVRAEHFMDIVRYTGTGSATDIAHELKSVPGMVLFKNVLTNGDWFIYHSELGASNFSKISDGKSTPTSTKFTGTFTRSQLKLGADDDINQSGQNYIAIIFAAGDDIFGEKSNVPAITCGKYTGNGTDTFFGSPQVNAGFESTFVLATNATAGQGWYYQDKYFGMGSDESDFELSDLGLESKSLKAGDDDGIQATGCFQPDPRGFRPRGNLFNTNTQEYIFLTIAGPQKTPTTANDYFTSTEKSDYLKANFFATGESGDPSPMDFFLWGKYKGVIRDLEPIVSFIGSRQTASRPQEFTGPTDGTTKNPFLQPLVDNAWLRKNAVKLNYLERAVQSNAQPGPHEFTGNFWRKAPGAFDVGYSLMPSTTSATTEKHNLGVKPTMIWRVLLGSPQVFVWSEFFTGDKIKSLLSTDALVDNNNNFTNITADSVTFDGDFTRAANQSYLTLYFCDVPQVAKIEKYTGNGGVNTIETGLPSIGFILITSVSSGTTYLFNEAMGIARNPGDDTFGLNLSFEQADFVTTNLRAVDGNVQVTNDFLNAEGEEYLIYTIAKPTS